MITRTWAVIAIMALATAATAGTPTNSAPVGEYGVFQFVIDDAVGSVDTVEAAVATAARGAGWTVVGEVDIVVGKDCPGSARVLSLMNPVYTKQLSEQNSETWPFAALDRIAVFSDEQGTHVSVVDSRSLNRTILMTDDLSPQLSSVHLQQLRQLIEDSVRGTVVERGYGQFRQAGLIGKTMGVVAGGAFTDLVREMATVSDATVEDVVAALEHSLTPETKKWKLHQVYSAKVPGEEVTILGITGDKMATKSFGIVKSGEDESRKDLKCPGVAYAPAYPLELVVRRVGDEVRVEMIDPMFRMKMYFEDAGKWAFMKNVKMPGSMDKEIGSRVKMAVKWLEQNKVVGR